MTDPCFLSFFLSFFLSLVEGALNHPASLKFVATVPFVKGTHQINHFPQRTHHAILPISRRHRAPATAWCASTDNALPSLLVWFWLLFHDTLSHHVYVFLFARMRLEVGHTYECVMSHI